MPYQPVSRTARPEAPRCAIDQGARLADRVHRGPRRRVGRLVPDRRRAAPRRFRRPRRPFGFGVVDRGGHRGVSPAGYGYCGPEPAKASRQSVAPAITPSGESCPAWPSDIARPELSADAPHAALPSAPLTRPERRQAVLDAADDGVIVLGGDGLREGGVRGSSGDGVAGPDAALGDQQLPVGSPATKSAAC